MRATIAAKEAKASKAKTIKKKRAKIVVKSEVTTVTSSKKRKRGKDVNGDGSNVKTKRVDDDGCSATSGNIDDGGGGGGDGGGCTDEQLCALLPLAPLALPAGAAADADSEHATADSTTTRGDNDDDGGGGGGGGFCVPNRYGGDDTKFDALFATRFPANADAARADVTSTVDASLTTTAVATAAEGVGDHTTRRRHWRRVQAATPATAAALDLDARARDGADAEGAMRKELVPSKRDVVVIDDDDDDDDVVIVPRGF
jgi:hypothetical protein